MFKVKLYQYLQKKTYEMTLLICCKSKMLVFKTIKISILDEIRAVAIYQKGDELIL